ncbi:MULTISPECIES: SRPBCC domain-containing protein [unclassified Haladaptatus]|uniref:SRPBCC family protein n=1 Tax=unclassified Haladaptatus TaxID=2622732 RepID=UPI0023E81619|nr:MULTISPECIES: SRPBCC domain-containing protein [unclassified Haladaptatus]
MHLRTTGRERVIHATVTVPASRDAVWDAWTTEAGLRSFFAPDCTVELEPMGAYELFFDLDADEGLRGGEGNVVLAIEPKRMLSFTWNAPPRLPSVRDQRTSVVVRFRDLPNDRTQVTLTHSGWGEGPNWTKAYDYFVEAWSETVLPRLKKRFVSGPVDWNARR